MSRTLLLAVFCTVAFLSASGKAVAQQQSSNSAASTETDPRVGKKVIVTADRAPLRTPKKIVWKAYRGEVFTVTIVNGEWLWVSERSGWLWEQEAIPFDSAVEDLTKQLKSQPTAENYDMRGIVYTTLEKYQEATNDFTRSLKLKPNVPGVLNNRGRALYLGGNYKTALNDFNAAIAANPRHFVALMNRALCHIATKDDNRALTDLNAALKFNKDYPEALNNRGVVYSRNGKFQQAVADYSAAIRIDPKYVEAYGNRAAAYRKMKKFTEARSDLELAIKIAPLDYQPVNDLAWFLATVNDRRQQSPTSALQLAKKACQMTQYNDWNTLDTLAAAHASAGDFKSAQQWITTALEKCPEKSSARVEAHQKLIMDGKPVVQ